MLVEAERTTLYEGESLVYRVSVEDSKAIAETVVPDFGDPKDFRVHFLGRGDRASTSSINGRISRKHTAQFTYTITPLAAGRSVLPAPQVLIDGHAIFPSRVLVEGRFQEPDPAGRGALTFNVLPQEQQDIVFLRVESDRKTVFPLQPFHVTLTVQVKGELPGDYARLNPLNILDEAPHLSVPWVDDASLPAGLRAEIPWRQWLEPRTSTRGGFAINNIMSRSAFPMDDLFMNPRQSMVRFAFPSRKIKRADVRGRETEYWEYTLERTFIAERLGSLTFGPVSVNGGFAVENPDNANMPRRQMLFVSTPGITVEVRDVPVTGRPEGYVGAFGRFDWSVDIQPRDQVGFGQPLTLTMTLEGEGSLLNAQAPDLSVSPEITSQFRLGNQKPDERLEDGKCVFSCPIRPIKSGEVVFPSIEIAYFDIESETFVTRRSEPITLHVGEGTLETAAPQPGESGLSPGSGGIFANRIDASGAVNLQSAPFHALTGIAAPFFLYVLLAGVFSVRQKHRRDSVVLRRRNAVPQARRKLAQFLFGQRFEKTGEAGRETETNTANTKNMTDRKGGASDFARLHAVYAALAADLADLREGGLTTPEICEVFAVCGVPAGHLMPVRTLLETLDAARFGGMELMRSTEIETVSEALFHDLELAVKNGMSGGLGEMGISSGAGLFPGGRFLHMFSVLLTISLGLLPVGACSQPPRSENLALYREAQTLFDEAEKETDETRRREGFEHSALAYERLLERGVRNGTLYYNRGNAWARAEQPVRAAASYRQALRFEPRDATIRSNLAAVLPTVAVEPDANWFETVVFWQNLLGCHEKYRIAVFCAWTAFFLGAGRLWASSPLPRKLLGRLAIPVAALAALAAISYAYDDYRFDRVEHALVAGDGVVVRKGNSERYEPAFTAPPPRGTAVAVLERRGHWSLLRFSDGHEGWLPDHDLVRY